MKKLEQTPRPFVVNMKILVSPNPLDPKQFYYSVAVGSAYPLNDTKCRRVSEKLTGKAFCPSLIYALTQDVVLNAVMVGGVK